MADKPRVCFVVNEFPRLSETFITSQITGLMAQGHDVSVVCDRIVHAPGAEHDREPYRSIMEHVRTRSVVPGVLHWLHRRAPARLHNVALALSDTLCDWRLNQYDALVAHFSHTGIRLARSCRLGVLKTPFVTCIHGYDIGIPLYSGQARKFRTLFRYGAMLLPVSAYFAKLLQDNGADPARIRVQRMGVSTADLPFTARQRGDTLRILSICRHVEKKGVRYALEALADLARHRPDIAWHYTLVGDGPLSQELKARAAALGMADQVSFTGPLPVSLTYEKLAEADVLLQPSVTAANGDVEGIPVVLMEAMASGAIVVSSRHSGISELVHDGETGLLAPERDTDALSRHLEYVSDHPSECEGMAVRARAFVEAEFDSDRLNAELAEMTEKRLSTNVVR